MLETNIIMNKRPHYLYLALFCFALIAGAILIFQMALGLEPCPLCILQRIAIILIAIIALIAYAHNPSGIADKIYGALLILGGLLSIGTATRQIWILAQPPEQVASCGPGLEVWLDKLIEIVPQGAFTEKLLRSGAACTDPQPLFLGWEIPQITYPVFLLLFLYLIWLFFKQNTSKYNN